MELTQTNSSFTPPIPGIATGNGSGSGAISSDFDTFLRMLTAQMQNQDPLNPIQSTDYATQLATFSGVEQQVRTNDLLSNLGQLLNTGGLSQYAGWVGMDARVAAPVFFDGQPITIYPDVNPAAEGAILVVTNPSGQEVSRQPIATDGAAIDWAGTGANGQPLANGIYTFKVESSANGSLLSTSSAQTYARVNEIKFDIGGMIAVLDGGIEVSASDISALRASPADET